MSLDEFRSRHGMATHPLFFAENERSAATAEHRVRDESSHACCHHPAVHARGSAALLHPRGLRDGVRHLRGQGGQGLQGGGAGAQAGGPGEF